MSTGLVTICRLCKYPTYHITEDEEWCTHCGSGKTPSQTIEFLPEFHNDGDLKEVMEDYDE